MTGVGGKMRLLSGGTGFLAISGIVLFALVFYDIGAAIVISSTIAIVFYVGVDERFLLIRVGFLLLFL